MKKVDFKAFVLTTMFVCSIGMAMAQKSAKEAIKYAESIDFDKMMDPKIDLKQCSYIAEEKGNYGIMSIDGNPMLRGGLIPSGIHMLQLHYEDFNYNSSKSVRMISENRQFHFEAGKSYHFDRKKSEKYELVIEEDSDNKIEYLRALMEYTEANPDRLNGTWNGEKKRLMNTFFIQYTLEGNKMAYEGKSKHAGMKAFVAEGRLLYNENILIMFPEKATANGKEVEHFSKEPQYIWYYTITDHVLHIEGGRLFEKGGLIWENTGEFRKTN